MAKMVGRKGMEHYHCKCCGGPEDKGIIVAREERQWRKEAEEEMDTTYVFSRPMAGYPFDSTRVRNDDDG